MSAFERPLLLRNGRLLRVWLAQALSQSANRVFQIAIVWWVMSGLKSVASGTFTALFLVACALPAVVFAKRIGSIIDRSSPRSMMALPTFGAGLLLIVASALFASGHFTLPFVIAAGFLLATAHAFYDPNLLRSLSRLVRENEMSSAIAVVTSTQSLANFGGAVLGAFLIDLFGLGYVLAAAGMAYATGSLLTLSVSFDPDPQRTADAEPESPQRNSEPRSSVLNAYPLLRQILIGFGLVNFFATPVMIILPLYVRDVLGGSARDLGWLEASIWLGLIGGTLVSQRLTRKLTALQTGTITMLVMGISLALPGFVASRPLYQVALLFVGLALGVNNLRFIALFQETIAEREKGRFFATLSAVVSVTVPASFLIFGFLGDRVSPQWLCLAQGAGVTALSFYFLTLNRSRLPLRSLEVKAGAA